MKALLRLLLFALFAFLVITIAAFVYLEWWQAILVSFATFLMIIYAGKLMIRSAVARLGNFASNLFRVKSQVLKGATVDVHSVRRIGPKEALAIPTDEVDEDLPPMEDRDWFEIELTLFPAANAPGPMTHWDIDDLRLVPADTPDRDTFDAEEEVEEISFDRIWIIENGEAIEPDQPKFHGPQRLRITAGFSRGIANWKFRYYFEQFGLIELPAGSGLR